MSFSAISPRFPTAAAIGRLSKALHLSVAGQDWEIELADATRVYEFLDTYECGAVDDDERFTLMALIVASYDEVLQDGGDSDGRLWGRIRRNLCGRFDLHAYTVQYWSLPDEDNLDHLFSFTPRAREIMTAEYGTRERWPRRPFTVKRFIDWPEPRAPGIPLNAMEINDERDGSFALWWSKFGDRLHGERGNFSSVADAVSFAAREFGVPSEKWHD